MVSLSEATKIVQGSQARRAWRSFTRSRARRDRGRMGAEAFPHLAAKESVHRERRCFLRRLPGVPRVAGRLRVASREVLAGHAGCGRTLCRHALPGGEVVPGTY
jgi:hypothetical protein